MRSSRSRAERDAVVVLGVNLDDLGDHRPGQRAAAERGARFPLVEAGFTKANVRQSSQRPRAAHVGQAGGRVPRVAAALRHAGHGRVLGLGRSGRARAARSWVSASVRVRHYRDRPPRGAARRPRPASWPARARSSPRCKAAGYRYVTLDLEGLRSGNLNAALGQTLPHDRR